jgi:16S rRNA (guanine527-N7)-methyltransferase
VTTLAGLADRYALPPGAADALAALLAALEDERAPTTVRLPAEAIDVHLADSLVALELSEARAAASLADLGSGAGFPALPLAAALPAARVAAVESTARKGDFIRAAAAAAGLANVEVVPSRAEEWRAGIGARDLVTARALGPLPVVLEYAAPLLAPGGHVLVWRGRRDAAEEAAGDRAAAALGLAPGEAIRVAPYPAARDRHLHRFAKRAVTPARFPRRAGMARKRPLA